MMMRPNKGMFRPMPSQAQGTPQRPNVPQGNAYGLMGQMPPMPAARAAQPPQAAGPQTANGQPAVAQPPAGMLGNDTMLAHVNPIEARMLQARGGSGEPNPQTGLPQFANPMDDMAMAMGGGMDPAMMGGGGMMGAPMGPPQEIGPETEDGGDESMVADIVTRNLVNLSEDEVKVLQKAIKPDVAWVLSQVFGRPAMDALLGRATPKDSGKSGSAGAASKAPPMPKSVSGPTSNESPKI